MLEDPAVTPIIKGLITRSALPLKALESNFAIDSTGFGVQSFYRHYESKYGHPEYARAYVKLHAMIGTTTNVITSAEVTDSDTHDSPVLPALVEATAPHFNIAQIAADKAYGSRKNLELIDAIGATPVVPFRVNAQPSGPRSNRQSAVWDKLFHFFHLHREEFLTMYHTRSNVESTFSAIKRKFGDTIRSKTPAACINECLLKVLCFNITCLIHEMHESGAMAFFPTLTSCPQIEGDAQKMEP